VPLLVVSVLHVVSLLAVVPVLVIASSLTVFLLATSFPGALLTKEHLLTATEAISNPRIDLAVKTATSALEIQYIKDLKANRLNFEDESAKIKTDLAKAELVLRRNSKTKEEQENIS
jgi:hypothetical protein